MLMPAKRLEYKPDPNKFDLRVHTWDGQGKLVAENHYRLFNMDGRNYFERPVNSGNLWYENNEPAGRVELTFGPTGKISSTEFKFDAPHKEFSPALTGADKIAFELEQTRAENERLKQELEESRMEQKIRAAVLNDGMPPADAKGAIGATEQAAAGLASIASGTKTIKPSKTSKR
jgi:hypothetical protein